VVSQLHRRADRRRRGENAFGEWWRFRDVLIGLESVAPGAMLTGTAIQGPGTITSMQSPMNSQNIEKRGPQPRQTAGHPARIHDSFEWKPRLNPA